MLACVSESPHGCPATTGKKQSSQSSPGKSMFSFAETSPSSLPLCS